MIDFESVDVYNDNRQEIIKTPHPTHPFSGQFADRRCNRREVITINPNSYISSLEEVEAFLVELKRILTSEKCVLDMLLRKTGEDPLDPFTTANTLADLDYDTDDVKDELLSLTTKSYLETMKDDKDALRPPFWVFGKDVQYKPVYIKVKIRKRETNQVFCVSFHYPRRPLIAGPYA